MQVSRLLCAGHPRMMIPAPMDRPLAHLWHTLQPPWSRDEAPRKQPGILWEQEAHWGSGAAVTEVHLHARRYWMGMQGWGSAQWQVGTVCSESPSCWKSSVP